MNLNVFKDIKSPIFFVTNDVARGIGLEKLLPNYHIVCLDDHPMVDLLIKEGVSIFCLERALNKKNTIFRSSSLILEHPLTLSFIKEKSAGKTPYLVFFKPQKKIEIIAEKNNFKLIGNCTKLNKMFEDKLNFFKIAEKENIPVARGNIFFLPEVNFSSCKALFGLPFVIQFGFGWAGNSTFFIQDKEILEKLKRKHKRIKVKVSKFISGPSLLNNAAIYKGKVYQSSAAVQIKATPELTSTQAGTGGRQWPAEINEEHKEQIKNLTQKVGKIMFLNGYRGFFGLDFLLESQTGKIYLSEINARLTASAPFYTKLELGKDHFPLLGYHFLSFIDENLVSEAAEENIFSDICGAEITVRNTQKTAAVISGGFLPGIYDSNLRYAKEDYFFKNARDGFIWLSTAQQGRLVNPEIEILRICSFTEVCDKEGNLKSDYLQIVRKVKSSLVSQKC